MIIKILDNALSFVGEIDDYESFFIKLVHGDKSMAHVTIGANKNNAEFLVKGNYIYAQDDLEHLFIITDKPKSYDERGEILSITAYDVFWILHGRTTNTSDTAAIETAKSVEYIIKKWIDGAMVSSANAARNISIIDIAADQDRGSVINSTVYQTPLDVDIKQLLSIDGMGLNGAYDIDNKKLLVDVYEGADRTVGNGVNPPVIFDIKYDNIKRGEERDSNANVINHAYIGGGDESSRVIEEYGTGAAGINRREVFLDGGDVTDSGELQAIGKANMVDVEKGVYVNADALMGPFEYGVDYFLGDYVTVQGENLQLLQADRVWEKDRAYQLNLVFGIRVPTTETEVQAHAGRIARLETKMVSGGGGGSGDVIGPAESVSGNIAVFDGVTGKVIADGGVASSNIWTKSNLPIIMCRAYLSSVQLNLVNATWTKVSLDNTNYDIATAFSSGDFVVPVSGYYLTLGTVRFLNLIASKRYGASIFGNGAYKAVAYQHSANTETMSICTYGMQYYPKDATIQLRAYSGSGDNTVDIDGGGDFLTYFEISLLSLA